jgi:hypothetical protein
LPHVFAVTKGRYLSQMKGKCLPVSSCLLKHAAIATVQAGAPSQDLKCQGQLVICAVIRKAFLTSCLYSYLYCGPSPSNQQQHGWQIPGAIFSPDDCFVLSVP